MTTERIKELKQLIQDYTEEIEKVRQIYFAQANPIIAKITEAENELLDIERGSNLSEYTFDHKPITVAWLMTIGCVFDEEDRSYRYLDKIRLLRLNDSVWNLTLDGVPNCVAAVKTRHEVTTTIRTLVDCFRSLFHAKV